VRSYDGSTLAAWLYLLYELDPTVTAMVMRMADKQRTWDGFAVLVPKAAIWRHHSTAGFGYIDEITFTSQVPYLCRRDAQLKI